MELPYDVLEMVFNKCDFLSQIRFRQIGVFTYKNLQMTDFYNLDSSFLEVLSDNILLIYPDIVMLDVSNSQYVTNINHLSKLRK